MSKSEILTRRRQQSRLRAVGLLRRSSALRAGPTEELLAQAAPVSMPDSAKGSAMGVKVGIVEALARTTPAVELVPLVASRNHAQHATLDVDLEGSPLVPAGERAISRWLAAGSLEIDIRGRTQGGKLRASVIVEHGEFRLLVTNRRLIASFNSAITVEWGRVESDRTESGPGAAVVMSWPLAAIGLVRTTVKWRLLGRSLPHSCEVFGCAPYSILAFQAAERAGEQWTASAPRSDWRGLVDGLVAAVLADQRALGNGGPHLDLLAEGQRRVDGTKIDALFEVTGPL
jgi:hypothetical protein